MTVNADARARLASKQAQSAITSANHICQLEHGGTTCFICGVTLVAPDAVDYGETRIPIHLSVRSVTLVAPDAVDYGNRPMSPRSGTGKLASFAGIERLKASGDHFFATPLTQGVQLQRTSKGARLTNVPHYVIHHSPMGYEWGYGGSGPADLALNMVEAALRALLYDGELYRCWDGECFRLSMSLHGALKWQFIAPLDRDAPEHVLDWTEIIEWIKTEANKISDAPVFESSA